MNRAEKLAAALRDSIFPNKCSSCGAFFHPPEGFTDPPSALPPASAAQFKSLTAGFLCSRCAEEFYPVESPKCELCGEMFISRQGADRVCRNCMSSTNYFTFIRSAGRYEGSLMALIHALKYNGKAGLSKPLGELLFYALNAYPELEEPDIVLPVPLHPSRARKRGYNQAVLLVRKWPALFRRSGRTPPEIELGGSILRRRRNTPSQTGLDRTGRKLSIRRAFSLVKPGRVIGRNLLLVDDVCTTGATLNECAKELKKGGAAQVNALTLARAPAHHF